MAEEESDDGIMFGAPEPQQVAVGGEEESLESSVEWLDPELRRLSIEADQVELPFGFGSPLLDDAAERQRADARSGSDTAADGESESGPPPSGGPKSWASLVSTRQASVVQPPEPAAQESDAQVVEGGAAGPAVPEPAPEGESLVLRQRKAWLAECAVRSRRYQPPPKPRGLVNNGNTCFMNVILQCLVACQSFFQLISQLGDGLRAGEIGHTTTQTIKFVQQFSRYDEEAVEPVASGDAVPPVELERQFSPDQLRDVLEQFHHRQGVGTNGFMGQQQDAHEFFVFLLDGLHEELAKYSESADVTVEESEGDEGDGQGWGGDHDEADPSEGEWSEVGKGNKTSITRHTKHKETPISEIFRGQLRSTVRQQGAKPSVTFEPFHCLAVDIQNLPSSSAGTLEEAILSFSEPETLDEYGTENKAAEKQVTLEDLPRVLAVQVKRFVYLDGQPKKLHRKVSFRQKLGLPRKGGGKPQMYSLFAVVWHHGQSLGGGHYTCDVLHTHDRWLRFDDTSVSHVQESDVMSEESQRKVYLLFFEQEQEPPSGSEPHTRRS